MPGATRPQAGERKGEHEAFIASVLNQVRRNPNLPGNAFKVAYEIAIHLNRKTREAWPSQATIATGTALSESTVKAMIGALRKHGHLHVEPGVGRGRSTRYRLLIQPEKGRALDPFVTAERGRDQTRKRVEFDNKKGRALDPNLMNDLGAAHAAPEGRERDACAARTITQPAPGGPDGPGATEEKPGPDRPEPTFEAGFAEVIGLYQRGHPSDSNCAYIGAALQEYAAAQRAGVPHRAIMAGAAEHVQAAKDGQGVGFLPPLPVWIRLRMWEREPWQRLRTKRKAAAHQDRARQERNQSTTELARKLYGGPPAAAGGAS